MSSRSSNCGTSSHLSTQRRSASSFTEQPTSLDDSDLTNPEQSSEDDHNPPATPRSGRASRLQVNTTPSQRSEGSKIDAKSRQRVEKFFTEIYGPNSAACRVTLINHPSMCQLAHIVPAATKSRKVCISLFQLGLDLCLTI